MKTRQSESGNWLQRWFHRFRLECQALKLGFDLLQSKRFKKYCERRGCPNLASLEEDYIRQLKNKLLGLQKRRATLKNGTQPALILHARAPLNRDVRVQPESSS